MKKSLMAIVLMSFTLSAIGCSDGPGGGDGAPDVSEESTGGRPLTPLSLPPLNEPFVDPAFGTTLRRITDQMARGGFGTHIYSQLQAFSSDNQYVLLIEEDYVVRRLDDLALMKADALVNTNNPRWQPARPHTLVFYDTNEDDVLRALYTNVESGAVETAYTFPSRYQRIRSNQSFDELSHDGRWMAGMASMSNGDQEIFSLDLEAKTLGAEISLNGLYRGPCEEDPEYGVVEPDWIGVSPLGNYLMVQWKRDGTERCSGLESFNIRTGQFVGHVYDGHQHGDLGVDTDGVTEYFMTFGFAHPSDSSRPGMAMHTPPNGVSEPRYLRVLDWGSLSHISCQGPNGVCMVTSDGEVWLQYTDGRVTHLAQHRSTECGYWVQPRASMARDGRYAIFASDWGVARCGPDNDDLGLGEAYVIDLTVP